MKRRLDVEDDELEGRVAELIERGLQLYGGGDLVGALSHWKHALALDEDSMRARDFIAYVTRHFAIADDEAGGGAFADSAVELDVPFGLATVGPLSEAGIEAGIDAYESFELVAAAARHDGLECDFDEKVPTRSFSVSEAVDEGWSLDSQTGELIAPRVVPADGPRTGFREETAADSDDLEQQLAGVAEGLEIAESGATPRRRPERQTARPRRTSSGYAPTRPPAQPADSAGSEISELDPRAIDTLDPLELDLGLELDEPEPRTIELEAGEPEPEPEPMTIELEADEPEPEPEPMTVELEADEPEPMSLASEADPFGPGTVEDLDFGGGTFELGEPLAPLPPPPRDSGRVDRGAALDFDLDLGKAGPTSGSRLDPGTGSPDIGDPLEIEPVERGSKPFGTGPDVDITFRDPSASATRSSAGLEDELLALERELSGEAGLEWQSHAGVAGTRPALAPLPPPERKPSRGTKRLPAPAIPGDFGALYRRITNELDAGAPDGEPREVRLRRRLCGLLDRAEDDSDLAAAAVAADLALSEEPDSALAQKLVHQRGDMLLEVLRRYLGDLAGIPAVALPMHEISLQELDHRTAFLLSRIDGILSFEDILDVSGMPRLEALRYLCRLRLQGILEVR